MKYIPYKGKTEATLMNGSNGRPGSLYEQTLECARREIDEASAEVTKIKDRLMGLEARMEAAKAVYEAVAARLNIEDEINEAPPGGSRRANPRTFHPSPHPGRDFQAPSSPEACPNP